MPCSHTGIDIPVSFNSYELKIVVLHEIANKLIKIFKPAKQYIRKCPVRIVVLHEIANLGPSGPAGSIPAQGVLYFIHFHGTQMQGIEGFLNSENIIILT